MNETALRVWMSADDQALEAEEVLRKMVDAFERRRGPLPSLAMQKAANRLRHRANFLLANLVEDTLCNARQESRSVSV